MSTSPWRVLHLQEGDAATLLADGIAGFDALGEDPVPTLRWYRTTTPAIVRGRGQGAVAVHGDDVAVVDRFSGGGAVWLSPDVLSLDVLLPHGHPWVADHVTAVFDRVGDVWLEALRSLGVSDLSVHRGASTASRRGSDRERLLAAVCYATRGRGEVLWRGRKLVGLAQRRRRHVTMVQCGLLRRWRPARLLTALGADPDDAQIAAAAVGLDEICADPPDDPAVMDAAHVAFAAACGSDLR